MIHGFFFRFYRMTNCIWLSSLLSRMAYLLVLSKFWLLRMRTRRRTVKLRHEDALQQISAIHPDPAKRPEASPVPVNPLLDLSIIVPVYNYVNLIEANIQSILNQKTQYTFELILVDDGSTDGARDVLRHYEDHPKVKVIFQDNQGIAGARNTGLNHASGRYIMFVDCDDVVDCDIAETLLAKAYADDCDIVMCAHNLVKERDGKIYDTVPNVYPANNLLGYDKDAEILNYAGLPWGKVYKRELWETVRYLPGYWFEDTIIHALLFTQCRRFAYVPKICYQYRWYESNFSHVQGKSSHPKSIDTYWMLLPILKKHKELGLPQGARFETMLLKHLSAYYNSKIAGLNSKTVEALFSLACDLYDQYGGTSCKLPYMLRVTKRALRQRDINLWKLASGYQR